MWKFLSPVGTDEILDRSKRWSRTLPPISVGCVADVVSYWSSKNKPALDAEGVVADFVVVRESKMYAAKDNLFESGVDEKERNEVKR